MRLYEDFAKSQAKQEVEEVIEGEGAENRPPPPPTHIFQVSLRCPAIYMLPLFSLCRRHTMQELAAHST